MQYQKPSATTLWVLFLVALLGCEAAAPVGGQ